MSSTREGVAEGKQGGEEEANNLKARLTSINENFQTFETEMKVGTRQRREKDEHRIAELTNELGRLELTLNTEIKRRVEMNKSVQTWAEKEIERVVATFGQLVRNRSDAISGRLGDIVATIKALEEKCESEMAKIPVDIERRGAELTAMLLSFEAKFEEERKGRLEREGRILKQLVDHEQEVAQNFDSERTSREATYADIRRVLEESIRSRIKGDENFQAFVAEEMASLKNAITLERQNREREDDEIVDALNRYTSKLQSSLKIINSSET